MKVQIEPVSAADIEIRVMKLLGNFCDANIRQEWIMRALMYYVLITAPKFQNKYFNLCFVKRTRDTDGLSTHQTQTPKKFLATPTLVPFG